MKTETAPVLDNELDDRPKHTAKTSQCRGCVVLPFEDDSPACGPNVSEATAAPFSVRRRGGYCDIYKGKTSAGLGSTILLIDDDDWFRRLVRTLLTRTPYKLIEAEDGSGGIALLRIALVDFLITDILMPGQSGLATIEIARFAYPGMKILAVSGVQDKDILREAELRGANATLEKPITKQTLVETLARLT